MKPRFHLVDKCTHAFVARPGCNILLQWFVGMRQNITRHGECTDECEHENTAAKGLKDFAAIHLLRLGALGG